MKNLLIFTVVAASIAAMGVPASAENTLYLNCACKTATDSIGGRETCADFSTIVDVDKHTMQWSATGDKIGPYFAEISAALISTEAKGGPSGTDNSRKDRVSINRFSGAYSWVITFHTVDQPPDIQSFQNGICTKVEGPRF